MSGAEEIKFNESMPIYLQVMEIIKQEIIAGDFEAGEKITSVRDLAVRFGVNPNTAQRALTELEKEELVYTERTAGRFVTENKLLLESMRYKEARKIIKDFFYQMQSIGYGTDEILELLPYDLKSDEVGQ